MNDIHLDCYRELENFKDGRGGGWLKGGRTSEACDPQVHLWVYTGIYSGTLFNQKKCILCMHVYQYMFKISKFWCMKWIVKHMLVSDLRNMLLFWLALGYLFIDHFIVPPLKTKGILFCTWWAGGLWTKQCPFNIFWLHHLKIAKVGTVYAPRD